MARKRDRRSAKLRELAKRLEDPSPTKQREALQQARALGAKAEPISGELLRFAARTPRVGGDSIGALTAVGPKVIPHLIKGLRSRELGVRTIAARCLGAMKAVEAAPPLIRLMVRDSGAQGAGQEAFEALTKIGSKALPDLAKALARSDTRTAACQVLVSLGRSATPTLKEALKSRSKPLRQMAEQALEQIETPTKAPRHPPLPKKLEPHQTRRDPRQGKRGPPSETREPPVAKVPEKKRQRIDTLIESFGDDPGNWDQQMGALKKIGPLAIEPLVNALRADNAFVREGAASTLAQAFGRDAVPALVKAADYGTKRHRVRAIQALERMGPLGLPATPFLRRLANASDETVARAARRALERIRSRSGPVTRRAQQIARYF